MYRELFIKVKSDKHKKEIIVNYLKNNSHITADIFLIREGAPCGKFTVNKLFGNFSVAKHQAGIITNWADIETRLFNKREINLKTKCWVWTGTIERSGYGQIGYHNKTWKVHRLSYSIFIDNIPDNLIVRHKCDNKKCFNPSHLELGTRKDNNLDTIARIDIKRSIQTVKPPKHIIIEDRISWYIENSSKQDNNCLLPPGKLQNQGYKTVFFKSKYYLLHRLILSINDMLDYNDKSWIAEHTCHNKFCINPQHLNKGDRISNAKASITYSRASKLTKDKVLIIKKDLYNINKYKYKKDFDNRWSKEFGVSSSCIKDIRNGYTWKDVI